jgi:peroxiredoxin
VLRPAVRVGQRPPDFLFEYAPGRPLRLRKLQGLAELVFWRDASKVSIETARELLRTASQAGGRGPAVLAINDGDSLDLAKRVAAQHGLSAALVTDPQRRISLAYGVSIWPTIVTLDASGVVRQLRYGRLDDEHVEAPSKGERG